MWVGGFLAMPAEASVVGRLISSCADSAGVAVGWLSLWALETGAVLAAGTLSRVQPERFLAQFVAGYMHGRERYIVNFGQIKPVHAHDGDIARHG